jgi:dethiobiotin synthetase
MGRLLFVTGTNTGVGKTALTALLLEHLLRQGIQARGLKPFCTGERTDASLLWELQRPRLTIEEVNPFYFEKPVSSWTAARMEGGQIEMESAIGVIEAQQRQCDLLLVEGAGGLLSPLGDGFSLADLARHFGGGIILVAANQLGVLNHTLLTLEALRHRSLDRTRIALTEIGPMDSSTSTNLPDLELLGSPIQIVPIPFLENYRPEGDFIRHEAPKLEGTLEKLLV